MLGNSFTFYHGMPTLLEAILGAETDEAVEVVAHTRGGASLAEQYNPETGMGARTLAALRGERWDYVVLQEQSIGPVARRESFLASADRLCELIRENGAKPVFYATWAYRDGSQKLAGTGMDHETMFRGLYDSYHEAAAANGALVADVGAVFFGVTNGVAGKDSAKDFPCGAPDLLEADDYHPSTAGSVLAASVIARVIAEDRAG